MAESVLYSFRRCPYAMRARMALHVSETIFETREVVLRNKPPQMLEASPKGTVPVLVLEDGTVLDESIDIMRWALDRNDPEGWLNGDDIRLLTMIDGPFKYHLDRYKYASRYDDADQQEHRAACMGILQRLEDRLDGQPFLCGPRRTLTDIAIVPFVRQFANTDRDWFDARDLPNLQRWLAGLLETSLFQDIMVKQEQWRASA